MYLEIISPADKLYEGEINLVQLPGLDGSFEILNNHAPLISALKKGNIRIVDTNNETHLYSIEGGVVEVLENKILVLVESVTHNM